MGVVIGTTKCGRGHWYNNIRYGHGHWYNKMWACGHGFVIRPDLLNVSLLGLA